VPAAVGRAGAGSSALSRLICQVICSGWVRCGFHHRREPGPRSTAGHSRRRSGQHCQLCWRKARPVPAHSRPPACCCPGMRRHPRRAAPTRRQRSHSISACAPASAYASASSSRVSRPRCGPHRANACTPAPSTARARRGSSLSLAEHHRKAKRAGACACWPNNGGNGRGSTRFRASVCARHSKKPTPAALEEEVVPPTKAVG
jgi:hypothetical protein